MPASHAATYSASGADAAAIQPTVAAFQADLGAAGRQVTWDDVPDNLSDPNDLPFNAMEPQGITFIEPGFRRFMVSATAASGQPPEFGSFHASHPAELQPFSGERLFTRTDLRSFEVNLVVPGGRGLAASRGFGIVFADVDLPDTTRVKVIGVDGTLLDTLVAPVADKGLSFVGATYPAAIVTRLIVDPGSEAISNRRAEGLNSDLVVMDDFAYGEPQAAPGYVQFTSSDHRVAEQTGPWVSHVTRSGNRQAGVTYRVEPIGGTATPGVDYSPGGPSYLVPGDTPPGLAGIRPLDDALYEGDETAVVRIVTDGYSEPGTPSIATFVITDDDPPPPASRGLNPAARDLVAPRLFAGVARSGRRPYLSFRLTEPAAVTARLGRLRPGRRVRGRCVAATRARRARPACTRTVALPGTIRRAGRAGVNVIAIPARLAGRRLAPGRYAATLTAVDAASLRSRPLVLRFTLTPSPPRG